jgi:SAM-dependent methyltransferase
VSAPTLALGRLSPWSLFGRALRPGGPALVAREDGGEAGFALPIERWLASAGPHDEAVLRRARGPVLDVGCGPGRHVLALHRRGVVVLGVDPSPAAIALARRRGAAVHQGSVFAPLPDEGRWRTVLLLDGNVGIGGGPAALLRRVHALLSPGGTALVEVAPPELASRRLTVRLQRAGEISSAFPWATLSAADAASVAGAAGFAVVECWKMGRRWFVELAACP